MKIIRKKNKSNNITLIGDINGNWYSLYIKIKERNIIDRNFILLGNFGIGKINKKIEISNLNKLNNLLIDRNSNLYIMMGDIDKKSLFKEYSKSFSKIKFIYDDEIHSIDEVDIFFIPGSINFDRLNLINKTERIKSKNIIVPYNKNIDVVISHDTPMFTYPYNNIHLKPFTKYDKWLNNDVSKYRKALSEAYKNITETKKLKIRSWYCGKYNKFIIEKKNKINFIHLSNGKLFDLI